MWLQKGRIQNWAMSTKLLSKSQEVIIPLYSMLFRLSSGASEHPSFKMDSEKISVNDWEIQVKVHEEQNKGTGYARQLRYLVVFKCMK